MNLHEHQAKALLAEYGVPIPRGKVAFSVDEAVAAASELGLPVVVKAQIHAGGRGKAGGVRLARTDDEVRAAADAIFGATLVTKQTGPEGRLVRRLLVEEGVAIARELYVSFIIDRSSGRPMCIASAAGGMDIEEVAAETPEKILTVTVDPAMGMQPFQARRLAFGLGFEGQVFRNGTKFLTALYRAFEGLDASQVEINPMLVTEGGDVLALDAKVSVDDSALFRQPQVAALRDIHEESPFEVEASKHRLSYIKLDGSVGCMVNGAGLAMATMDIVKLAGASPANFLDVGGGASADQIENAFRILSSDPEVRLVLINIFGGILRCDRLARGLIDAVRKLGVTLPIVIRMEGTNVELARRMLEESGLDFTTADGMRDAAEQVVKRLAGQEAA